MSETEIKVLLAKLESKIEWLERSASSENNPKTESISNKEFERLLKRLEKDIMGLDTRIRKLEEKPAKHWYYVLAAIISGMIGFLLTIVLQKG